MGTRPAASPFGTLYTRRPPVSLQQVKRNNSGVVLCILCLHSSQHIIRIDRHYLQQFEPSMQREGDHGHRR
jgi:hypothetical protein